MLGCVAYSLCFAQHPFQDKSQLAIVNADYNFPIDKPADERMKDLIRWLLTPDQRERPSIETILRYLEKWSQLG